jgi:chromosome segregation ATPase
MGHDRQILLTLEQRYTQVQGEIVSRTIQMRTLTTRIKVLESQNQSKTCAIESSQKQLQEMAEKASSTNMHVKEVQEQNSHLNTVLCDLSSKI